VFKLNCIIDYSSDESKKLLYSQQGYFIKNIFCRCKC